MLSTTKARPHIPVQEQTGPLQVRGSHVAGALGVELSAVSLWHNWCQQHLMKIGLPLDQSVQEPTLL